MKIFLSHSNRDKALVREIKSNLPSYIKTWIDEEDLLVGMDLIVSIQKAIQEQADYVVIFLGREAVKSDWVKKELNWALRREKEIKRNFVLPVLLEDVWNEVEPAEFKNRLYLKCFDQSEKSIKAFTENLKDQIFAWLNQNLDKENVAKLKKEKESEQLIETLEKSAEIFIKFSDNSSLKQQLQKINKEYQKYGEKIQLERLSRIIKRELKKQSDDFKDAKKKYEESDNSIAQLSISLTFGGYLSKISLLEKLNDEIEIYENNKNVIDPVDVLDRINKILGENVY